MAKKAKKLSEAEILAKVTAKVDACGSWATSSIAKENEKVQHYYDGALPKKQREGNSGYVSSDVYDAVEAMKAQLLETFAGGHDIIRFNPRGVEDRAEARIATKYTSHVIFQQNAGYEIFQDVIEGGLMTRNSVAQVEWEEKFVYDEHKLTNAPLEQVEALLSQEDVEVDVELDNENYDESVGPTYSGTWKRRFDKSGVRIEVIPPEEFIIEPRVKRREDGMRGRRTMKTIADLIEDGYPRDKIKEIGTAVDDNTLDLSGENVARHETTDTGLRMSGDEVQPELRRVMLHEIYMKMALTGDKAALYRIVYAGQALFECTEVDEDPYVEFRALRRAHAWHGNNFAARVISTQNARTVLTRGILDHTANTITPRWQVLNGTVSNPRELLDGRNGGIVNVKQRDGIAPLQYANLNPFVFQTIEMLKANKEENTGISALSQGLNKDAISTQNSQGLVGDLVALSQVRQKVIARNFAYSFLIPLWLKVYRLVIENDNRARVEEISGEQMRIDAASWVRQRDVTLSLHLGYGEQEREAMKLEMAYTKLASDPGMAPFITPEKRWRMVTDTLDKHGIKNFADYLETPDKIEPPQPDPIEMKKLEIEEMRAKAALITAQAAAKKAETDASVKVMKQQLDEFLAQLKVTVAERDADRKDLDVANRVDVAQRELELVEAAPDEQQSAIISPNS